jgi:hypothetical protein
MNKQRYMNQPYCKSMALVSKVWAKGRTPEMLLYQDSEIVWCRT